MTITPYPWQEEDQRVLAANNWTGLLNIEVGGGKSYAALWAAQRSQSQVVLIVAPLATFETAWKPSVRAILGLEAREIGNTGKAKKEALADFELGFPGVYLCTPEMLTRADISTWYGDMCVVDECHLLSKAGGKGQRKYSGKTYQESKVSLSHRFKHRLALSGTAWRNNFERAWATARFLHPELDKRGMPAHDNEFVWKADRLTSEEVVTGFEWVPCTWDVYKNREDDYGKVIDGQPHIGKKKTAKKWLNEAQPGRLISELPCVITHKRRERCCAAHPEGFLSLEEPNVTVHTIPLHPKQKKAFAELQEQYLTWLGHNPLIVELPITMQIRLRQLTLGVPTITFEEVTEIDDNGEEYTYQKETVEFEDNCVSPFTDELLERLKHLGEETAVVWVDSQRFATVLTKRLNKEGYPAFEFSGQTKKTRDADLAEFGVGKKYKVMVAVIAAASTGVDSIQHKTSTEFWLSESTDMTLNEQAKGRADRLGARKQVDRHYFVDDLGYAQGAMDDRLARQIALNATLRKAV